ASPTDSVLVEFMAGIHQVLLIARDSTGDIDTCIYLVELRDTIDPVIVCQNDTLYLHPAGVDDVDLFFTTLVVSASDNCSIQSIVYEPPFVNCAQNGQTIPVTMTVFDQSGNTASCTSSLFVSTEPLMPLWQRGVCDDTLKLFANIPAGPPVNYTFTWTGPNSYTSGEENPIIPGADTSYSGTYFLTVQSDSGCVSMGSVEVLIQTIVSPTITSSGDTICTGEEIELTTQTYSGDVTYQWYQIIPNGDTILTSTTEPSFTTTLVDSGAYIFYAIVIQDTCSSMPSSDLSIFVVPVPIVSVLENNTPLCIADTLYLRPEIIIDSLQYHWTGPNGYEAFVPEPPGIPVSGIDSGAVFILTASSQFCISTPDSLIVNIQSPPDAPVISGDSLSCEGGMFLLIANSSADQFEWIDPVSNSTVTNTDSLLITSADQVHSGSWHVIAFENGCPSDTSVAFIVKIDTSINIEIIAIDHVCEGDSIQFNVIPENDGTYSWTGPNGFTSNAESPLVLAEEGIYIVSVLTTTGCESEDSIMVQVDVLPVIISLDTDAGFCADSTTTIHITAEIDPDDQGTYIYQWEGPSGFTSQDSALEFQNATSAISGEYSLYIQNGLCISDTATVELTLLDSPDPPVVNGDHVYCNGDTIILTIDSPIPGGIYTWS